MNKVELNKSGQVGSFEEACRITALQVAEIVIAKQHDYGHDNIMAFREQGLVVRLWDKVARLKNLLWIKKETPKNEPIVDTFTDIAGYAIIGLMLANSSFLSDLKEKEKDNAKG